MDLLEEMAKVQKPVLVLESLDLATAQEQQLGLSIAQDILNCLNPLFHILGLWSRSKDTPGDLLEECLQVLESQGATHLDLQCASHHRSVISGGRRHRRDTIASSLWQLGCLIIVVLLLMVL